MTRQPDDKSPFAKAANAVPSPKDDASSSYESMERAIEALPATELGAPVLPCQKPSFEVTLADDGGMPIASARYVLAIDGEAERSGTLDAHGSARFDDIDLDPAEWTIVVDVEGMDGDELVYHLSLVRSGAEDASTDDAPPPQLAQRVDLPLHWLRT